MKGLSLRTKVFFLFAGAALLIVVPALLLIANAVEEQAYGTANETLDGVVAQFDAGWPQRADNLLKDAQLRANDSDVLRAWSAGRPHALERAIRSALGDNREVVVAADTAFERTVGALVPRGALEEAMREGPIVALPDTGAPLLLAVVKVSRDPLRLAADTTPGDSLGSPAGARDTAAIGYLGLGTRLSAQEIRKEIARPGTAGTEVALVLGDSVASTTFADSLAPEVRAFLKSGAARGEKPTFHGQTFLAKSYQLPTGGVRATVVLFRRITDELAIANGIKQSLFGIGFAALVLALVLAFVVSRIVARPAQALADASIRLARGDYAAPLPRDSGDEIGQLARAFGEMRSAIGEREQRLRSAQAEMIHREKLAAMGRLVAQLSHEINNPIYNIQNCLEALERRGDPADPNREFLTLAQEELARMATLTRQLLDQSRPLSDAAQPVDLNQLAQRVLTLARGDLSARQIHVVTDLQRALPPVVVHPEGIQQVLANLVNNACDAMPRGGTLRLATRADPEAVELVVEDTGTGIAEVDLPHIFEAFYTTKPGVAGLGLGLFVSEGIIRGHRGRLSVESSPGEGSRFTVRLPRETLDEAMRENPDDVAPAEREVPAAAA
jgi:signal transduction histidine kinase